MGVAAFGVVLVHLHRSGPLRPASEVVGEVAEKTADRRGQAATDLPR
jgi:hypothetical protein